MRRRQGSFLAGVLGASAVFCILSGAVFSTLFITARLDAHSREKLALRRAETEKAAMLPIVTLSSAEND